RHAMCNSDRYSAWKDVLGVRKEGPRKENTRSSINPKNLKEWKRYHEKVCITFCSSSSGRTICVRIGIRPKQRQFQRRWHASVVSDRKWRQSEWGHWDNSIRRQHLNAEWKRNNSGYQARLRDRPFYRHKDLNNHSNRYGRYRNRSLRHC